MSEQLVWSTPIDEHGVPLPTPRRAVPPDDTRPLHTIQITPGCGLLTDDEQAAQARESAFGPQTLPEGMEALRARVTAIEARLAALEGKR